PTKAPIVPRKPKWEGEDEEEDEPVSDWEESSEEEEEEKPVTAPVAPPKKKGTLKQKLAEKEAEKARKKATGEEDDSEYDSDQMLDPREKARRDKERQMQSDLNNAADLFGAAALGGTSSNELDLLISFQPRTKEDFQQLSAKIIEFVIKRHQNKPLYHFFVEHHVRELAAPLKDVEVRKAASGLTTLANEKQKEQREKATGGKKKAKGTAKPGLAPAKLANKFDTTMYDEALDDFGNDPNNFM
ncbi:Eukaryotic translation initiation factor 3 subunit J, partial [Leucoagaricus sp. SymC.cos]